MRSSGAVKRSVDAVEYWDGTGSGGTEPEQGNLGPVWGLQSSSCQGGALRVLFFFNNENDIGCNKKDPQEPEVHIVKAVVFPVVIYGCESWTIKKAEHRRIDAFKLWC